MKKSICCLVLSFFAYDTDAQAGVITFEDATPANGLYVAQGYKGFGWTGGSVQNSWVLGKPGSIGDFFTAHTGSSYVWNNGGTSLTMSGPVFSFNSFWVRFGHPVQPGATQTARGFLNGIEIYTRTFNVGNDYSQVNLNFAGIDSIKFDESVTNLVIDDIVVETANSAVPEPASMITLAAGALCMLGFRKRKRRLDAGLVA